MKYACLGGVLAAFLSLPAALGQHDHGAMADASAAARPPAGYKAEISTLKGRVIGSVSAAEGRTGLLMEVRLESGSGLTPGLHGLHFHDVGLCVDTDGFKTAGGHLGQKDAPHGLLAGGHAGDVPNIGVAEDGSGLAEFHAPRLHLTAPARGRSLPKGHHLLLDSDGSALIIHGNADDHWSQPIGNAGGRAACAAFTRR